MPKYHSKFSLNNTCILERVYLCRSSKETNTRIIFVVSVIEFKILKLVPALSIISSA